MVRSILWGCLFHGEQRERGVVLASMIPVKYGEVLPGAEPNLCSGRMEIQLISKIEAPYGEPRNALRRMCLFPSS